MLEEWSDIYSSEDSMKKLLFTIIDIVPVFIFHIINFFRYKIIYKWSIVSSKAMLFKTKLGYKTRIWWEVGCFRCKIWDFTYLNSWVWWNFWDQITTNLTNVEIGRFCSIGPNIKIPWGDHKTKGITTSPINFLVNDRPESDDITQKKTIIWNDVRIWVNVTIISGIHVWDGAIIWAGAVVTKDVEPYAVVWGVPAKIIKRRYDQNTIKRLLEIQRRNRPSHKIKEHAKLIWSEDIAKFLKKFEQ